ncbi:hypothetical protein AB0L20_32300, partial [Streptomyces albidoflavus]|uniref:hypothetical protein n=1 Tax=Streptomyces albidoflavus TaxID=1886 RepID=UPI0034328CDF
MATIAQTTEELDLLRKELFDAARVMTDPDERAKLQAAVAEIDALLDKLAVSVLHKTEAKLGPLRQRVEVLTDDAEERPSEPKAA